MDGVVVSILNLKKGLEKRGHKVYVFAPSPDGKERFEDDTYFFTSTPFLPYPQYKFAFPDFSKLSKVFSKYKIDVVHNHGVALTAWAALKMARQNSIPAISTFHTNIAHATHYIAKAKIIEEAAQSVAWNYLKFLYSKFDVVSAPTNYALSHLVRHGINGIVVPNGIDTSIYKGRRRPVKDLRLLHVGRVVKEKEIDVVFPFLKSINAVLEIVGKGPHIDYFRKKALHHGVAEKVRFLGFVDDAKLKELYKTRTALVFTSTFDTQGLVVGEAMASGMPVIARQNTAAEELTDLVFNNSHTFRDCVITAKINEKCVKCRRKAKKFDIEQVCKQWEVIYSTTQV